ncbi:MAG: hypothetical protein J6A04_00570, partial [Clostridia bacterium]|nr:hypothetical protein [Clostridia bacterium]
YNNKKNNLLLFILFSSYHLAKCLQSQHLCGFAAGRMAGKIACWQGCQALFIRACLYYPQSATLCASCQPRHIGATHCKGIALKMLQLTCRQNINLSDKKGYIEKGGLLYSLFDQITT